jgi:hypothetical protein
MSTWVESYEGRRERRGRGRGREGRREGRRKPPASIYIGGMRHEG